MKTLLTTLVFLITVSAVSQSLSFSHTSGFYGAPFELQITGAAANQEVRYTLDGTMPSLQSDMYTSSILIELDRQSTLSFIPTSESWTSPQSADKEAVVFRCQLWSQGIAVSDVITHTYFIGANFRLKYPFDIVALTTDPANFFDDETGIYTLGTNDAYNFYYSGDDWERPVYLQLFDTNGNLEWDQHLGARIHGRSSRANPQKSLRLYARNEYGDPYIFHPIFGESNDQAFKRIVLKAPEKLFNNSLLVDPLAYHLVKGYNMETMDERSVAVFINGEYWGVHYIRERQDEHYLRTKLGVDSDEVDIIDWDHSASVSAGNDIEFQKLMTFLEQTDLSTAEGLASLETRVDLANFTEYISAHLFFANEDFPNNNCRMWREQGFGKKWRFFFFDCDACMRDYEQNSIDRFTNERNDGNPVSLMLSGLINNPQFSAQLTMSLIHKMETSLSSSASLGTLDSLYTVLAPQMPFQMDRWNHPNNMSEWNSAVSDIRTFLLKRNSFLTEHIQEFLSKPFEVYPSPAKEILFVKFAENAFATEIQFTLFDASGRRISTDFPTENQGLFTISLPQLPQGFYFLHTTVGNVSYFDKIIIS